MKTKPLEQRIEDILAYYESDGSNITMPKTVEAISNLVEEEVRKAKLEELKEISKRVDNLEKTVKALLDGKR